MFTKTFLPFFSGILLLSLSSCSSEVSASDQAAVEVIYAVVPRTALPRAVVSPEAALAEEAKLYDGPNRPAVLRDFSVVLFISSHAKPSPLTGTLRIWMPTVGWQEVELPSVPVRTTGIYVIDGGGHSESLQRFTKKWEWKTLRVLL